MTSPSLTGTGRRGQIRRLTTYAAGSVVAAGCSELALVVCYGLLHLPAGRSALVAWLAGALPNYWLNRSWTWRQRGRPSLRREVLPYVVIILVTLVLAVGASHAVAALLHRRSDATRTAALAITFFGVYVVVFFARYALLNRLFQRLSPPVPPARDPARGPATNPEEPA